MTSLLPTLLAAIFLMILVVCCLGIGWLLTGKSRLKKRCGWTPSKDHPDQKCSLCGKHSPCDEENDKKE